MLLVAVVGVVALGLVFLLFRAVVRSARKEQDRIARRTVPAARVVERRDK